MMGPGLPNGIALVDAACEALVGQLDRIFGPEGEGPSIAPPHVIVDLAQARHDLAHRLASWGDTHRDFRFRPTAAAELLASALMLEITPTKLLSSTPGAPALVRYSTLARAIARDVGVPRSHLFRPVISSSHVSY